MAEGRFDASSVILPAGTVIGGYFLVDNLLGKQREKEFEYYKKEIRKTTENIERLVENQDNLSREDYKKEAQEYKPKVKGLNKKLEDKVDVSAVEEDLKGRSWKIKAVTWKKLYLNMLTQASVETVGETRTERFIEGLLDAFPYLDELLYVGITVGIMSRLLDFGDGGGGLNQLKNFKDWVYEGIYGAKDILGDVDIPEEDIPEEESPASGDDSGESEDPVETDPDADPYVEGTARAAFAALGVATPLAMQIIDASPFNPMDTIRVGEAGLDALADATGAGVNFLVENPAVTIGLVIVAIALALTYASPIPGDEVVMTGIASKYLATVEMTGIGIAQLKDVGFKLQGNVVRT